MSRRSENTQAMNLAGQHIGEVIRWTHDLGSGRVHAVLITYTMRPDRAIPAHAALWEIRGDRLVWLASAYRSEPPNTREDKIREWVTAELVGPAMLTPPVNTV